MEMDLQRGSVNAVVIKIEERCTKMKLPNGKVVDILPEVFEEISKWTQKKYSDCESGGYILGYRHESTGNISLELVTAPQSGDICSRCKFILKDIKHKLIIKNAQEDKSYYMGLWHTHPQVIPNPSIIDLDDWKDTLLKDKPACEYIFFFIAGIEVMRVWVGDIKSKEIIEIYECDKVGGIYKKI